MQQVFLAEYVLPIGAELIENGEVLVDGGRICEVGKGIAARHPDSVVHDLGRAALLPGFVNAHSHIDYTFSRNRCDGLSFWGWINKVGLRKGKTLPYDLMLASARLGAAMCAASGITCLGDSSFTGAAVEALHEIGLRGVVYKEVFGQSMGREYPERFADAVGEVRSLQAGAGERIRVGLSPHAVYTTNAEVLRLCAEACADLGIPIAMHLAETRAEEQYTKAGSGPIADWRKALGYEAMVSGLRPAEVLLQAGLLRPGACLAHCIDITDDEIGLIAHSGATVAHCPRSNARLGEGIAPIPALCEAGAVVGLGTDSAASCGALDFFDEMRTALMLHRASSEDAGVLSAKHVLEMATAGGAAALGLQDVGKLEPGMRADMVAVDISDMLPGEDVHLAILSRSPADLKLVLVDGGKVEVDVRMRTAELYELMERADIA